MATVTLSTDDLTGETLPEGTPTTRVIIKDPRNEHDPFEIDLSDDSLKGLLKAVEKFRVKGRAYTLPTAHQPFSDVTEASKARAWALAERPDLNPKERGMVPKAIIVAYRAHLENTNTTE